MSWHVFNLKAFRPKSCHVGPSSTHQTVVKSETGNYKLITSRERFWSGKSDKVMEAPPLQRRIRLVSIEHRNRAERGALINLYGEFSSSTSLIVSHFTNFAKIHISTDARQTERRLSFFTHTQTSRWSAARPAINTNNWLINYTTSLKSTTFLFLLFLLLVVHST